MRDDVRLVCHTGAVGHDLIEEGREGGVADARHAEVEHVDVGVRFVEGDLNRVEAYACVCVCVCVCVSMR